MESIIGFQWQKMDSGKQYFWPSVPKISAQQGDQPTLPKNYHPQKGKKTEGFGTLSYSPIF
ncbi:hypothetical protein FRX31_002028 [Thalictrum thalictroides]|uniref:Uncharacterized protein n=1 Tax=Thalictrum thalictroides TaxID=46969 RepID=A0A7J6XF02_THATH|nr:hypothetical protein FRX31_002028 [Thalictrum thalictroides]